nr:hypothetical protein [Tanacetum cinerariifolium]
YINTSSWDHPTICYNDDDEDYTIAITPVLSTKELDNSLSMGDEHLDTIPETESDEVIKSSVKNLVSIPSESEGIPDNMCDVPFHDNSPPLNISKDHIEDFFDSNDDSTFSIDDIEYVEASPLDSELISSELLNINLPIANIKALKDNPTPSSDVMTKSSSTSLKSDFYEFADELAHIVSPPEYDCFSFKNKPNSVDFTMDVVEDTFQTRKPRVHVHNVLPTHPNL